MKNEKYKLDETRLTADQRKQLDDYNNTKKQLETLQDIADIAQELVHVTDDTKKVQGMQMDKLGAVMTNAREQLVKLNNKKDPETPDFSKPVVEAVAKLEKALGKLEVKPSVTVSAPDVIVPKLDLTPISKLLKEDIPAAFEQAIKLIPVTEVPPVDNSELLAAWEGISQQLLSIETATRMKPVFPTSLKVTNVDGSAIGGTPTPPKDSDRYGIQAVSEDATYKYYFFEADDADYYVMRKHLTNKVFSYTAGTGGYATVYQSAILGPSGSPTWGDRGSVF